MMPSLYGNIVSNMTPISDGSFHLSVFTSLLQATGPPTHRVNLLSIWTGWVGGGTCASVPSTHSLNQFHQNNYLTEVVACCTFTLSSSSSILTARSLRQEQAQQSIHIVVEGVCHITVRRWMMVELVMVWVHNNPSRCTIVPYPDK